MEFWSIADNVRLILPLKLSHVFENFDPLLLKTRLELWKRYLEALSN